MPPRQSVAQIVAAQLAALIPNIVNQVTAAMQQNPPPHNQNNNNNNNHDNDNNNHNHNHNHNDNNNGANAEVGAAGCNYKGFMACHPKEFDGKGGALAITRWIEKMEAVIDISYCAAQNRERYSSSLFVDKALTWWNTQIQARGRAEAMEMTWEEFRTLQIEEFCPSNEMQKLENEFWNLSMEGPDHVEYTGRFHELAKLVPHLVTPETKRINRYIYGLVPEIRAMVQATEPVTIQSAILKAGALTVEMIRSGILLKGQGKKREISESSKQGFENKKAKVSHGNKEFDKKGYTGNAPKCNNCGYHHYRSSPCRICEKCNRTGHLANDCRAKVLAPVPQNAFKAGSCFECGSMDHYRNACPKLNNADGATGERTNPPLLTDGKQGQGNRGNNARGRAYVMGAGNDQQNADANAGNDKA